MKKLVIVLIIAISLGLCGCKSEEEGVINNDVPVRTVSIPDDLYILNKFKKMLMNEGCQIGSNQKLDYEKIGAHNGYRFTVDGKFVEIYEFKLDELNEKAKEVVESAKEGQVILEGDKLESLYKDGILLVNFSDNDREDIIKKVFEDLFK